MSLAERVGAIDWTHVSQELDAQGHAMIERLLSREECETLAFLYSQDEPFRCRVVTERHGFGRGEYEYFAYPLPGMIGSLRMALYPHLVPIATRWNADMGIDVRYPEEHERFIERCHQAVRQSELSARNATGCRQAH